MNKNDSTRLIHNFLARNVIGVPEEEFESAGVVLLMKPAKTKRFEDVHHFRLVSGTQLETMADRIFTTAFELSEGEGVGRHHFRMMYTVGSQRFPHRGAFSILVTEDDEQDEAEGDAASRQVLATLTKFTTAILDRVTHFQDSLNRGHRAIQESQGRLLEAMTKERLETLAIYADLRTAEIARAKAAASGDGSNSEQFMALVERGIEAIAEAKPAYEDPAMPGGGEDR